MSKDWNGQLLTEEAVKLLLEDAYLDGFMAAIDNFETSTWYYSYYTKGLKELLKRYNISQD